MAEYLRIKFGAELCSWISASESYMFGDIIPHAILNVEYHGNAYLFIPTERLVEEFNEKFQKTEITPLLRTQPLEAIVDLQPISALRCWFNGDKILGKYVKMTSERKMVTFHGNPIPDAYIALGFVPQGAIPERIKRKSIFEHMLDNAPVRHHFLKKLLSDRGFVKEDTEIKTLEKAFNLILQTTSSRDGYTYWVLDSYLNGGIRSMEDLGVVKTSLRAFTSLVQKPDFTSFSDINRYCGLVGCDWKELIEYPKPFRVIQTNKCTNADGENVCGLPLSEMLEEFTVEETGFLSSLSEEELKDIIHNDGSAIVVKLSSEKSAKCWGRGTQWCTAAEDESMFDHYAAKGDIYMIVDKLHPYRKRFQLHPATSQFMNTQDSPVDLENLHKMYPRIVTKDDVVMRGPKWKPDLITDVSIKLLGKLVLKQVVQFPPYFRYGDFVLSYRLRSDGIMSLKDFPTSALRGVSFDGVKRLELSGKYTEPLTGVNFNGLSSLSIYNYPYPFADVNFGTVTGLQIDGSSTGSLDDVDFGNIKHLSISGDIRSFRRCNVKNVESLTIYSIRNSLEASDVDLSRLVKLTSPSKVFVALRTSFDFLKELSINGVPENFTELKFPQLKALRINGDRYHFGPIPKMDITGSEFPELESLDVYPKVDLKRFPKVKTLSIHELDVEDMPHSVEFLTTHEVAGNVLSGDLRNLTSLKLFNRKREPNIVMDADLSNLEELVVGRCTFGPNVKLGPLKKLSLIAFFSEDLHRFDFSRLEELTLDCEFAPGFSDVSFPQLKILKITKADWQHGFSFKEDFPKELPALEKFSIEKTFAGKLPESLPSLKVFYSSVDIIGKFPKHTPVLETLIVYGKCSGKDLSIPSLKALQIQTCEENLPDFPMLIQLNVQQYNHDFPSMPLLETLSVVTEIVKPIDGTAFPSLKSLRLGQKYNHDLIGFNSLEKLSCASNMTHFHGARFPSLKKLSLGSKHSEPITKECFPVLEDLSFSGKCDFSVTDLPLLNSLYVDEYSLDINDSILPSLVTLDLRRTKMPIRPENFPSLKTLTTENVSGNLESLETLTTLKETIDLSGCVSAKLKCHL